MALVKCEDCGEDISTKATACPKCGAPTKTGKKAEKKKTSGFTWFVLVMVIFFVYLGMQETPTTSRLKSAAPASATKTKTPTAPKAAWQNTGSEDAMTGKKSAYAISLEVEPTRKMDFPYGDVTAWLGVGCDGKNEWTYVSFNTAPNLNDTETEDGYNLIRTRIKFDNKVENITISQKWGAKTLHFRQPTTMIENIAGSNSMVLELRWHSQGVTHFIFPLRGSSAALKKMRDTCSTY